MKDWRPLLQLNNDMSPHAGARSLGLHSLLSHVVSLTTNPRPPLQSPQHHTCLFFLLPYPLFIEYDSDSFPRFRKKSRPGPHSPPPRHTWPVFTIKGAKFSTTVKLPQNLPPPRAPPPPLPPPPPPGRPPSRSRASASLSNPAILFRIT